MSTGGQMVLLIAIVVMAMAPELISALPFSQSHIIMPYLCLQRCGNNLTDIEAHIRAIQMHNRIFATSSNLRNKNEKKEIQYEERKDAIPVQGKKEKEQSTRTPLLVNAVAFEAFDLGPNSTIVPISILSDANSLLKQQLPGVLRIAMITSVDFSNVRHVFAYPDPFIDAVAKACVSEGMDGVNIDFEPNGAGTHEDGIHYATFVQQLGLALSKKDLTVSADVARWNYIWNFPQLAKTLVPFGDANDVDIDEEKEEKKSSEKDVDVPHAYVMTMNTYTYEETTFESELNYTMTTFASATRHETEERKQKLLREQQKLQGKKIQNRGGNQRVIIGLETWPHHFTMKELAGHFTALAKARVCQLAVWDAPIQDAMWGFIESFGHRCIV